MDEGRDITGTIGTDWPTCGWTWADDRVCGRPADAFRRDFLRPGSPTFYYCRRHINALRHTGWDDAHALLMAATETHWMVRA